MRRAEHGPTRRRRGVFAPFIGVLIIAATAACAALAVAVVTLHLSVRPVLTGSMRPTYGPGAVVVTEPVPVTALHPGMIVLFTPPGEHAQFAHRIVSVSGPRTTPIITTKGDANRYPDPWHAQLTSATVPRVIASVPFVGRLMVGLRGAIQLLLTVLGGLMVAVTGTRWILQPPHTLVGPAS